MENKKDILRVTMKDINLLPDDILVSSANSVEKRKMKAEASASDSSKTVSEQSQKTKEGVANHSKNLKDSLMDSIQQNSDNVSNFLSSLKKEKIRNLERLVSVDKKDMVFSNKKNHIYTTESGRMVIVDRDIWGEPCAVTVKEATEVSIRRVMFFENEPFLFPIFNDKNLTGEVIYMANNEIWYLSKEEATIVLFRNDKPDFLNVSLKNFKSMNNKKALHTYLDSCKILYLEKKINDLIIEDRNVSLEDIIKVRAGYAIYKNSSRTYKVLLFDEYRELYGEYTFNKLPSVKEEGWDLLFSKEIVDYVKENNYVFENFRQDDGHIEYWQNIGTKKVCVLRCKI